MDGLFIKETVTSPAVDFDPEKKLLAIKGQSCPLDTLCFYMPVYNWLKEYLSGHQEELTVEIDFNYLNTSSIKCVLNIIDLLEEAYEQGKRIKVNWYYDSKDESQFKSAVNFKEDVNLPFYLIPADVQH